MAECIIQNLIIPSEDFWSRRANAQTEIFELAPFGIPAKITANRPDVLAAAQLSAGRFSRAAESTAEIPITIQIVVGPGPDEPVPTDLPERLLYAGVGEWVTLSAGVWGHAFANLATRQSVLFLAAARSPPCCRSPPATGPCCMLLAWCPRMAGI